MPDCSIRPVVQACLACLLANVLVQPGTAQPTYSEAEWPLPATTAAGTPAPWHFGEVVAVATTSEGNILVLHRGASPVMEFDVAGNIIRSRGDGSISEGKVTAVAPGDRAPGQSGYTVVYGPAGCYSCGAHSIRVDPEGSVWIVDAAAHTVSKTDSDGRVLLQLGKQGESGTDESFAVGKPVARFPPRSSVHAR